MIFANYSKIYIVIPSLYFEKKTYSQLKRGIKEPYFEYILSLALYQRNILFQLCYKFNFSINNQGLILIFLK